MKIAPFCLKLLMLLFCYSFTNFIHANSAIADCEDDFEKPTIAFPEFKGLGSGDTMFLVCASQLLGAIQDEAVITDNCDPNPLIKFSEYCEELPDCSLGYKYFAEYDWTIVDNNNNVTEYTIYAAIGDKITPNIKLNWGDNVNSGDTIQLECGYAETFDESYVTAEDSCEPSLFCNASKSEVDVFFQERILSAGDCSDYLTKMLCTWYATDVCGNQSSFELVVLLTDNTPPEFANLPDHFCGSASITETEFAAYEKELSHVEVVDRCSNVDLNYTVNDLSDGCDYFIQWEAIDACGNTSYHEQHVCIKSTRCVGNISGTVLLDIDQDQLGDQAIPEVDLLLVEDINGNGIVDGGEEVYATTSTDENGFYSFRDVPQGCYVIVELQPSGFIDSKDEDVTNPGDTDRDGTNDEVDNLIPVCITPGEFDDGNDFVEEQVILDILLTEFNGTFNHEINHVTLTWKTAFEINTDYFLIERSSGVENFETLNKIVATGNQNEEATYTYQDKELSSSRHHLYRLVEVELDGTKNYSELISVQTLQHPKPLLVYPNPSNGTFNIRLAIARVPNAETQISVYDILGNKVFSALKTENFFELDLQDFSPGTYLLSIESSNFTQVKKIYLTRH